MRNPKNPTFSDKEAVDKLRLSKTRLLPGGNSAGGCGFDVANTRAPANREGGWGVEDG